MRYAEEMVDGLRLRALLDGYRGAPAGDRRALLRLLRRVSALADALPELREMDLNPVRVLEPGRGVDERVDRGHQAAATSLSNSAFLKRK